MNKEEESEKIYKAKMKRYQTAQSIINALFFVVVLYALFLTVQCNNEQHVENNDSLRLAFKMHNVQTVQGIRYITLTEAKQCAMIAVENEYYSLREQLFNLRSSSVIESEKVYLTRLDTLNLEEKQVKTEIENL